MAFAIFFLSGFAALLYQVVWQRLLVVFSGADVYSVTLIVAAFMAGLGIGNLAGGHVADRVSARRSLWLFVAAEVSIGLFALASKWIYYDLLYHRLSFLAGSSASGPVLFLGLFWPTFFMGVSLPLLARALTSDLAAAGRVVGSLYGWNTLGAAVGAFATTWLLLPRLGLADALPVGAALNFICAALGWTIGRKLPASRQEHAASATPVVVRTAGDVPMPFGAWALLFGVTGFSALALEIVWFRMLGVVLKSTAFTFGTMLTVYLLGLGAGAAIAARWVSGSRTPGRTFLLLQFGLVVVTGVLIAGFADSIADGSPTWLVRHLSRNDYDAPAAVAALRDVVAGRATADAVNTAREFLVIFVTAPAVLIGPATFLMGFSFPYLQKAVQADAALIGRRVGTLMTGNIAGSAIGAALTGLVLLPAVGTATTLKLLVVLALVPGILLTRAFSGIATRSAVILIVLLVVAGLARALPDGPRLWAALHAIPTHRLIVEEDGAGVTVLKAASSGFDRQTLVYVNGLSQSWIPFGNIHTVLGALPLLIHPEPLEIGIIGLGSGDTAFSAGGRPETRRITCVEIIGGQVAALERLSRIFPDPGLTGVLNDARIDHVIDDGRAYILQAGRAYDIIEADALRPATAYSGNLYSIEYFELLRRHLRPGGLAVTWVPTERVARTFVQVFPYVIGFGDVYIGSNDPIDLDPARLAARLEAPSFIDYYARAGIDIRSLLGGYLRGPILSLTPEFDRGEPVNLNSDLFPRDEFALPAVLPF